MSTASHNTRLSRSPTSSLIGVRLVANAVWYRSKAKLKGALSRRDPNTTRESHQRRGFPPEIVEMIIARLVHDIPALKACAATCLSWYNIAFPHIHHTLVFRDRSQTTSRRYLNPLVPTHKLGLLPFVKKAQFNRGRYATHWIVPAIFDSRSMRYFRALVNLQDLAIESLDFSLFPQGVGAFFGHFSPTLRSLALTNPLGSRRQLVDFFRLFPGLDDLVVCGYYGKGEGHEPLDDELMAIRGGLRGRLHLKTFHDEGLLKDIIVAFGGIRFTFMRLESVSGVPLLLKACADTLQTVHIYPGDRFLSVPPPRFNFSRNAVLQSLEIPLCSLFPPLGGYACVIQALSTITSPVFSEVVIVFFAIDCWEKPPAKLLAKMYKIKQFEVVFCLQTSEELRAESLHSLIRNTRKAVAKGTYDFLPCPPVVCSRPVSSFNNFCQGAPTVGTLVCKRRRGYTI